MGDKQSRNQQQQPRDTRITQNQMKFEIQKRKQHNLKTPK